MLSNIIEKTLHQIETLEIYLKWFDILNHPYADGSKLKGALDTLKFPRGALHEESLLRHTSVISRLYSIFEKFVEDALSYWLDRMPLYYCFEDVPKGLKNRYREGISRIIRDVEQRRYQHLNLESILPKYIASIQGEKRWGFVNDALIYHANNLRRIEIEKLFVSAGFDNIWDKLVKNKNIIDYEEYIGERIVLEKTLEEFVNYRNDSAHGSPDEILGSERLRDWLRFIKAFCLAIEETVNHKILLFELEINPSIVVGNVSETYRNNILVGIFNRCWLEKGKSLIFLTKSNYVKTNVVSLQLYDHDYDVGVWIPRDGIEVGIKTELQVGKKAKIILI